jgi:hypothetical protein
VFKVQPEFETFQDDTMVDADATRHMHKLRFGPHTVFMADIRAFPRTHQSFITAVYDVLVESKQYSEDELNWALFLMEWLTEKRVKKQFTFEAARVPVGQRRKLVIEILAALAYKTLKLTQGERAHMYDTVRENLYKLWKRNNDDLTSYIENLQSIEGTEEPFEIGGMRTFLFDLAIYENIRRVIEDQSHTHMFVICGRNHSDRVEMLMEAQLTLLVRLEAPPHTSCIVLDSADVSAET